jgi:phage gp36-like protein
MLYITGEQLAESPGARELAEVATATHSTLVEPELMEATLRGDERTGWTVDEITVADDAHARIVGVMENAESIVDGYLARSGYSLPLSPVPLLVSGWVRDIGRYILHKDRISAEGSDPILRAYRDAMKLLQLTAEGKFGLGANDSVINNPDRIDVQFNGDAPAFSRSELKSFR